GGRDPDRRVRRRRRRSARARRVRRPRQPRSAGGDPQRRRAELLLVTPRDATSRAEARRDFLPNPLRDPTGRPSPGLAAPARAFHEAQPDYAPTALHSLPSVARELRLGRVLVKDESARFGLPAFKALGAFWAANWAIGDRDPARLTLVAATEGNHGRAVAAAARRLGARAHIVIPAHTAAPRADAILDEGAVVERIDGGYEDA